MATESWLALGAGLLLAMGILVQGMVMVQRAEGWGWAVTAIRVAAAVLLAAACATATFTSGRWAPLDSRQTALGLASATVVVHLMLTWCLRLDGPGAMADTLALVLSLVALAARPGVHLFTWVQKATAFQVQWGIFVLGTGAATVAGSSCLRIALRPLIARIGMDVPMSRRVDVYFALRQATGLAWLVLGAGLVLAIWWAWQSMGSLVRLDLHTWCMAVAWLVSWISLLSWHLGKRAVQWAAGLAVLTAGIAIFGLLGVSDLTQVLGN